MENKDQSHINDNEYFTSFEKTYNTKPDNERVSVSIQAFDEKEPTNLVGKAVVCMIDQMTNIPGKDVDPTGCMMAGFISTKSMARMLHAMAEAMNQSLSYKMMMFVREYFVYEMDEHLKDRTQEKMTEMYHESIANLFKKMREDAGE